MPCHAIVDTIVNVIVDETVVEEMRKEIYFVFTPLSPPLLPFFSLKRNVSQMDHLRLAGFDDVHLSMAVC